MARRRIDLDDQPEETSPRPSTEQLLAHQNNPTDSENGYFDEINRLRANVSNIEMNSQSIVAMQKDLLQNPNRNLTSQLDELTTKTQNLLKQTRAGIKGCPFQFCPLHSLNDQTLRMSNPPKYRKQQESSLAQSLRTAAEKFKQAEESLSKQHREILTRQYRVVNPDASSREIEQAINEGGSIFSKQILTSRDDQKRMLQEVQSRNIEIQKIERQVIELFELMKDMETMIDEQQVIIDVSDEYVEKGINDIVKAEEYIKVATDSAVEVRKVNCFILTVFRRKFSKENKQTKWKLVAIIAGVIIVLIIVIAVYFASKNVGKTS
ncbi:Plasma membrane t-SNARE, secretory vesicle fusion [Nowakowskiella sp. JEL0078]|nr:Plasma membrane t-SNARE, secretory vesicle fusion [Nowakowskiella sp. JEL0078]